MSEEKIEMTWEESKREVLPFRYYWRREDLRWVVRRERGGRHGNGRL